MAKPICINSTQSIWVSFANMVDSKNVTLHVGLLGNTETVTYISGYTFLTFGGLV